MEFEYNVIQREGTKEMYRYFNHKPVPKGFILVQSAPIDPKYSALKRILPKLEV